MGGLFMVLAAFTPQEGESPALVLNNPRLEEWSIVVPDEKDYLPPSVYYDFPREARMDGLSKPEVKPEMVVEWQTRA